MRCDRESLRFMSNAPDTEWFDRTGPRGNFRDAKNSDKGLRFDCTLCGGCCTGAEGFVNFTDDEAEAMADDIGVPLDEFLRSYTHNTPAGRSLTERKTDFGYDCIFLNRKKIPGKAVCGVYKSRPVQCRTWPFWASNLSSEHAWRGAAVGCPGVDRGKQVIHPSEIRIQRAKVPM